MWHRELFVLAALQIGRGKRTYYSSMADVVGFINQEIGKRKYLLASSHRYLNQGINLRVEKWNCIYLAETQWVKKKYILSAQLNN